MQAQAVDLNELAYKLETQNNGHRKVYFNRAMLSGA